jgi:pseudaminic acid synthase
MKDIEIAGHCIGDDHPAFVIAEMSANHDKDLNQALALVDVAFAAAVDAVKLQTYTPATMTALPLHPSTRVDPIWGADNLYNLYAGSAMPYDFHEPVFKKCIESGLIAFSSAYDESAVDFLEVFDIPAYKIASFELVHLPLLKRVAQTGKPVILSTGMASLGEVEEALNTLTNAGAKQIALMHCCSSYPAKPEDVNLNAIPTLKKAFGYPVGFSDHTLGINIAVAAVVLGACLIEKHYTNDRFRVGPDHRFSLMPQELDSMVRAIREVESARGSGRKCVAECEVENRTVGRRSIFTAKAIPGGTVIGPEMLKVVRPGSGLHPRYLEEVIGRVARKEIPCDWPLNWEDI